MNVLIYALTYQLTHVNTNLYIYLFMLSFIDVLYFVTHFNDTVL